MGIKTRSEPVRPRPDAAAETGQGRDRQIQNQKAPATSGCAGAAGCWIPASASCCLPTPLQQHTHTMSPLSGALTSESEGGAVPFDDFRYMSRTTHKIGNTPRASEPDLREGCAA